MHVRLKTTGERGSCRAWRRNGSAGASTSRAMNWLGKVDVIMFTGVASPSRYEQCCRLALEVVVPLRVEEVGITIE